MTPPVTHVVPRAAYRALEDIVGAQHVSEDPAILDGYAFQYLAELVRPENSPYMPRPAAVVLPSSTEEVQAVVRLANDHGLKVKALSLIHISEPTRLGMISYAVFCLKKKKKQ